MMVTNSQSFIPFSDRKTRGNNTKIKQKTGDKDVRKYFFPNPKLTDDWNKLPEQMVNAKNIDQLKTV